MATKFRIVKKDNLTDVSERLPSVSQPSGSAKPSTANPQVVANDGEVITLQNNPANIKIKIKE